MVEGLSGIVVLSCSRLNLTPPPHFHGIVNSFAPPQALRERGAHRPSNYLMRVAAAAAVALFRRWRVTAFDLIQIQNVIRALAGADFGPRPRQLG